MLRIDPQVKNQGEQGAAVTSALIVSGIAFVLTVIVLMFFYVYYGEHLTQGESLVVFGVCLAVAWGAYLWRRITLRGWLVLAIIVLIAIVIYPWLR